MSSLCTFPFSLTRCWAWLRIDLVSQAFPEFTRFPTPKFPPEAANFAKTCALASLVQQPRALPTELQGNILFYLCYFTACLAETFEAGPVIVCVLLDFFQDVLVLFFEEVLEAALGL